MRKFTFRLLLFLLPLVVLSLILDLQMSRRLSKAYRLTSEIEVWDDIYSGGIEADIAVYGSSRAWVQINPKILEDTFGVAAYNLGMDGSNFLLQYLRHQEYIKHNKAPKTIILALDVFSFEASSDVYKPDQMLPYMLWNTGMDSLIAGLKGFSKFQFYIPMLRYSGRYDLLEYQYQDYDTSRYRYQGYRGMDKSWNSDLKNAESSHPDFRMEIDNDLLLLFERFIEETRATHIELILVYPPEYIEGQKFVKNRPEILALFEALAINHQLTYFDFSNHDICSDRRYFYNASHLNMLGANLFTVQLAECIKTNQISSSDTFVVQ